MNGDECWMRDRDILANTPISTDATIEVISSVVPMGHTCVYIAEDRLTPIAIGPNLTPTIICGITLLITILTLMLVPKTKPKQKSQEPCTNTQHDSFLRDSPQH